MNYIHNNPVKHGLVERPEDWPWSTYHRYVRERYYGRVMNSEEITDGDPMDFGE